jgi:hypothetical protein
LTTAFSIPLWRRGVVLGSAIVSGTVVNGVRVDEIDHLLSAVLRWVGAAILTDVTPRANICMRNSRCDIHGIIVVVADTKHPEESRDRALQPDVMEAVA